MSGRLQLMLVACLLAVSCDKQEKTSTTTPLPTALTTTAEQSPKSEPDGRADLEPRPLIDAHAHINALAYGPFMRVMEEHRIVRVVNMSGGSSPERRAKNLEMADKTGGRIALFHNIDWSGIDKPGWTEREVHALERSVADGFAGLKISKALGLGVTIGDELVPVDSPKLDPIWARAGELGVPVGIHTGDPKAFFEKPGPQNERHAELSHAPHWSFYGDQYPSREELLAQRDRMVAKHPGTTFILLHFANNPEDVEYVDALLREHPNAMVDVAARLGEIGRHDARKVREIFERHQDRILFATDIQLSVSPDRAGRLGYRLTLGSLSVEPPTLDDIGPFYAQHRRYFELDGEPIEHPVPIQGDWKVNPASLPEAVLEKLYVKNAERVIFAPWLARQAAKVVAASAGNGGNGGPR